MPLPVQPHVVPSREKPLLEWRRVSSSVFVRLHVRVVPVSLIAHAALNTHSIESLCFALHISGDLYLLF